MYRALLDSSLSSSLSEAGFFLIVGLGTDWPVNSRNQTI